MPIYQLFIRETTWTLASVMRHRFSQFFGLQPEEEKRWYNLTDEEEDINCNNLEVIRAIDIRGFSKFATIGELLDYCEGEDIKITPIEFRRYLGYYLALVYGGTPSNYVEKLRNVLFQNATDDIRSITVDTSGLKARIRNVLEKNKCKTIGDILDLPEDLPGLGTASKKDLYEWMDHFLIDYRIQHAENTEEEDGN